MLSGYPPFNGPNDNIIFNKILRGAIAFTGLEWVGISEGAIALIKRMLTVSIDNRPCAEDVLKDP